MPTCNNCGGFVSPRFSRVFGDNEDKVYGCVGCRNKADLYDGAAVEPPQ